jgi:hypothetical protein
MALLGLLVGITGCKACVARMAGSIQGLRIGLVATDDLHSDFIANGRLGFGSAAPF